jgi:biopolymer transport protein ExbB/TolQ
MVRFVQAGGTFMYPIAVILAIGLAISVERYIYLTLMKSRNRVAWSHIQPLMLQGKIRGTIEYARGSNAHLSRMLVYALGSLTGNRRAEDLERVLDEGLMELIPRLEKRTPYLATFANIATLLGLLGTILGLIAAFSAVAHADPAEKADLLSGSISVAMNTTAFGLLTAIPLLLIHAHITTVTSEIVDSMEMAAIKLTNMININASGDNAPADENEAESRSADPGS